MSSGSPFKVLRPRPVAGGMTEHAVPGGIWALELRGGAQPGARIGFQPGDRFGAQAIPFDARGARLPLDGIDRFYLHWPTTLASSEELELIAWTVPARYDHSDGGLADRQPVAHVLAREEVVFGGAGASVLGPFTHLPDDLVAVGSSTRLPRGARLVAHFAFTGSGVFTSDVLLYARTAPSATFRALKGLRGVGVPSAPTTELGIDFDMAAPLGEFQFRIGVSGAATVGCLVYLLLD